MCEASKPGCSSSTCSRSSEPFFLRRKQSKAPKAASLSPSLAPHIYPNASIEGKARILPSIPYATCYWLSTTTLQIFG